MSTIKLLSDGISRRPSFPLSPLNTSAIFGRVGFLALMLLLILLLPLPAASAELPGPDWLRTARLASEPFWTGMTGPEIQAALQLMDDTGVNVVDADLSSDFISVAGGSWVHQPAAFSTLQQVCGTAHTSFPGMKVFAYLAPLEYVSSDVDMDENGVVDPGLNSIYTVHPEWLQQGIDGSPALFYGAVAFWVGPHDEDAWLCLNDPVYRQRTADLLTAVTASGVDGVYLDVPLLLHEYGGSWEHQWSCHCDDCAARFLADTGSTLPTAVDFGDPVWRRFVAWRLEVMAEWIDFCRATVEAENPDTVLIIEHWNGLDDGYTKGDTPTIYPGVSHVRAHEWGNSADNHYFTWLAGAGYHLTYRGIDGTQPSWILSYANPGAVNASRLQAASVIGSGCCFWETSAPDMAGSADYANRTAMFDWLAPREDHYYAADVEPYADVCLLYSPSSLAYLDGPNEASYGAMEGDTFAEYMGTLMMLLESHLAVRVISEDDLASLTTWDGPATEGAIPARALVCPRAGCLDDQQLQAIRDYVSAGGTLVATWETSLYDEEGVSRGDFGLADVFGVSHPYDGVAVNTYGAGRSVYSSSDLGLTYYWFATPNEPGAASVQHAESTRQNFLNNVWTPAQVDSLLDTDAHRRVLILPWQSSGEVSLSLLNYRGVGHGDFVPIVQNGISLTLEKPATTDTATAARQHPFLAADTALTVTDTGAEWTFNCDVNLHTLAAIELATASTTLDASLSCVPSSGTLPFATQMTATLTNTYTGQLRRLAAKIHLTLASGSYFANWRAGFTNVAAGSNFVTAWNQNLPALGTVVGDNLFHLVAEDVTPAPYNQPPYPPAGDMDTDSCTVTGVAP